MPDSPGIPPSATAHELFRGFSFVAPALLDGNQQPPNPLDNQLSTAKVRNVSIIYWPDVMFDIFGSVVILFLTARSSLEYMVSSCVDSVNCLGRWLVISKHFPAPLGLDMARVKTFEEAI